MVKEKYKSNQNREIVAGMTLYGPHRDDCSFLINDTNIMEIESDDVLVVTSTGAYGYSMSSNYNKIPKPAVVSVMDGNSRLICKRQSYDELLQLELEY